MLNSKDKTKIFKDPIYGYITLPLEYSQKIVDTAIFQRLRRVLQTSYSPLYASAIHNRFVHSVGVFHLGNMAAKSIATAAKEKTSIDHETIDNLSRIYTIACLLHDVGHSPFSHTGEIYYKYKTNEEEISYSDLHARLLQLTDKSLKKDLPPKDSTSCAKPHEIMSAIVGIQCFGGLIGDKSDRDFFARCITGYLYNSSGDIHDLKNCYIKMLNSKVIDVDRLDYLIRDAYATGFATITIDYERLLNAITIVRSEEGNKLALAYHKNAVSVIENVIYAHDAEKKWIQNHPVVLYETYLIRHTLEELNKKLDSDKKRLFSEQSLYEDGHLLNNDTKISLLCDDDIMYLAKSLVSDETSKELFSRKDRRHPIWKSEAEYKAYLGTLSGGEQKNKFVSCLASFSDSRNPDYIKPTVIDESLIEKISKELLERKKQLEKTAPGNSQHDLKNNIKALERKIKVCKFLLGKRNKLGKNCDFIILQTTMFTSNFSKTDLSKELISFESNGKEKVKKLEEVCALLTSSTEPENCFYLFYKRGKKDSQQIVDVEDFCKEFFEIVVKE